MPWLRALLFLLLSFLNTAVCGSVIVMLALLAMHQRLRPMTLSSINAWAERWVWSNRTLLFGILPSIHFDLRLPDTLNDRGWYLLLPNHQSWVDIVLLFHVFYKKLPFLKFFLKYELLYVPFLGIACKALNMPFMKRYSRAYLQRHPEKKGEDLKTTRASCAYFLEQPAAVVNFMEGTRLTEAKQLAQNSPYRHLLRPKSGGVGFVMSALGDRMDSVLDIVIVYPSGIPSLLDLAMGRLRHVIIDVRVKPIPSSLRHGDYENDAVYRAHFQEWIQKLWSEKDDCIEAICREEASHA